MWPIVDVNQCYLTVKICANDYAHISVVYLIGF